MNIANAVQTRFNALLVEGDKGLGLESALREQDCSVQRVSTRAAAEEGLEIADVVVISAADLSNEEVVDLVRRAVLSTSILVHTEDTELAVKAAKLGASIALGGSVELVSAQIGQLLAVADLKRRAARPSSMPASFSSTSRNPARTSDWSSAMRTRTLTRSLWAAGRAPRSTRATPRRWSWCATPSWPSRSRSATTGPARAAEARFTQGRDTD